MALQKCVKLWKLIEGKPYAISQMLPFLLNPISQIGQDKGLRLSSP